MANDVLWLSIRSEHPGEIAFYLETAGILTGIKLATLAVVLGLARADFFPNGYRIGVRPPQEPSSLPSAQSVPRACNASSGARLAVTAAAEVAAQQGAAVLIHPVGEVLAGDAGTASLPFFTAPVRRQNPLLHADLD